MQQRPLFVVDAVPAPLPTEAPVQRRAWCPKHPLVSKDYCGVNSSGLVFRCEGDGKDPWHYFIAEVTS